jgi:hypothetical protein
LNKILTKIKLKIHALTPIKFHYVLEFYDTPKLMGKKKFVMKGAHKDVMMMFAKEDS